MSRAEEFQQLRPLLFSIAYRILGSVAEAEDAVQETWLRYAASPAQPTSARAFLIGAGKVARVLASIFPWLVSIEVSVEPREVNGQPGAIFRDRDGKVLYTLALDMLDGPRQSCSRNPEIDACGRKADRLQGGSRRHHQLQPHREARCLSRSQETRSDDKEMQVTADRGQRFAADLAERTPGPLVGHASDLLGHSIGDLFQPGMVIRGNLYVMVKAAIPAGERHREEEAGDHCVAGV